MFKCSDLVSVPVPKASTEKMCCMKYYCHEERTDFEA